MKINNQKGFVVQGIIAIIALCLIAGVAYYVGTRKVVAPGVEDNSPTITIMVPNDIPAYEKAMNEYVSTGGVDPSKTWPFIKKTVTSSLTDDVSIIFASAEAAAEVIPSQASVLERQIAYLKIVDSTAYIVLKMDIDGWAGVSLSIAKIHPIVEKTLLQFPNIKSVKFAYAPGDDKDSTSDLKMYVNVNDGYSFSYPSKLKLSSTIDSIKLSHTIPFENRDGGCDMKGDSELSKTLDDFDLSIKLVTGEVKPSYVDGTYSKGILNGNWSYMGAEGCGQTSYYFPVEGGRTLVITKNEIQILSNIVNPEIREKVLAIPGVISFEESKLIIDQILSTFKFATTTQPSITVFSPNGGETYKVGDTINISWNGGKNPLELMIETYSEGELVVSGWIATNVDSIIGKYTWKVGNIYNTDSVGKKILSTLPPGKYFIRLSDFKTGDIGRSSSAFTITN